MKRSSLCVCLFLAVVAVPAALPAQSPTFSSIQRISTGAIGAETSSLAFHGNFNGNGNTDLIVSVETNSSFTFLTGDGTGKFSITGPVSALPAGNVLVTDVNGDGKDDIVTLLAGCQAKPCSNNPNDESDADGIFTVTLSQGNGKFTQGYVGTLPPGLGVAEGVVADFNKDGKPDIAVFAYPFSFLVPYSAPAELCIFLNQGNGTFTQTDYQTPQSLWTGNRDVTNMVVGDFEGNGNQDIAFAFQSASFAPLANAELLTFAGDGRGNFGPGVVSYIFDSQFVYSGNADLFAADLNGDGRSDLVIIVDSKSSGAQNPVRVPSLLANTSGRFYWSSAIYLDKSSGYPVIMLSDLNGDGKPDLLFLDLASGNTSTAQGGFYLGLGTGAFKSPHIPTTFAGGPPILAFPLKKGALPSLFVPYGFPYIQMRINTTR